MPNELAKAFGQEIRVLQIIKGALLIGVVSFGGVATMLALGMEKPDNDSPLPWVMLGFAAMSAIARLVVPRAITSAQRKSLSRKSEVAESSLMNVYRIQLVVGSALLEAGAFGNLASFMLTGQPLSAGIAMLLGISNLIDFPTVSRVQQWLVEERRLLTDESRLAGSLDR